MHVVTVVARNFLPRAAVLARTYREHNPGDRFWVLVVDAEPDEVAGTADYAVLTPADLDLAADEFQRMALIYDVTELSTALKPWALDLLLARGAEVAMYLDADIAVYASLHDIEALSLERGIVLTPHTTVPMPRDGLAPNEAQIMAAGIFNLGFIALDQSGRSMLAWWQERLLRDCVSAPTEMLFADQRWIDLVPGYFRHTVLSDPTYNVAYWNLDSRPLVRTDGVVHVEGQGPLHFFHFSGYEPDRPWVLTKYHLERPRVVLSEHPVVAELCREYAGWITDPAIGAGPRGAVVDLRYRFDRLPDGTRVTRAMRSALRVAVVGSDRSGAGHPPGWHDGDAVRAWFCEPVRDDGPTNRYLHALWQARSDLQARFPAPLGADSGALLEWAWSWATVDPDIVVELLPAAASGAEVAAGHARGVNLAGYFTSETGVGEMGRLLVDGVRAAGLPCSTVVDASSVSRQDHAFAASPDRARYPVTIAAVNADELPRWVRESDPALRRGRTVGMWAWEVEEFAGYDEALELVDEVWTLSTFSRDAIARATDKPVHVVPLPVREPEPAPQLDRAALGLPEGPYLLFVFDYLSVFERKNPLGLVAAFCRAFPEGGGPGLVVKSVNGDRFRSDRERLRSAVAGRPDITLVEDFLDRDQLDALMAGCAAYVSLHRAEGYGLTMAEAMARGRPVVATAYSGNLDFMDDTTALLVPHELAPVPAGSGPYPASTVWAEPDLERAAAHLRWVAEHPAEAAELGTRAAARVRETGSISRTADFITDRVDAALAALAAPPLERDPDQNRAERAIKRARRAVREPATGRRLGWLGGFDRRQQERFHQVLQALGLVRRRADRALKVAQENRRELRRVTERADALEAGVTTGRLQNARVAGLADAVAKLRERVDAEARAAGRQRQLSGDGVGRGLWDGERLGFGHPDEVPDTSDVVRGTESAVLEQLAGYAPLLAGHAPVLDVGCGRGELLRVLAEHGTEARGVDLDADAVNRAKAHGVDATVGDGVETLSSSGTASWGAVVATRVVEHLTPGDVRRLFGETHRALRRDGMFVVEAVNPHAPGTMASFWVDPGHVRPYDPDALLLLARECGYRSARIDFVDGSGDAEHDLRTCTAYTLVATA